MPDSHVLPSLQARRTAQKRQRLAAGGDWVNTGLVFTSPKGTPLDHSKVRKQFRCLLKAAQLPMMRLHGLCHTCATLLIAQGVHPRIVMETLGHSQISVTMDLYTHVSAPMQAEAAAKMDAAIG